MDAVLDELRSLLGVLSDARCGVEGNAALLRYVNANLVDIHRKLQARYQQDAASRTQEASAGLQGARTSSAAQQPGRHTTSNSARAGSSSRMPSQGLVQQQQQQQQQAHTPRTASRKLPAGFMHLQQLYASLEGPAGRCPGPSVTSAAAAGFLNSLDSVYGQQSLQQQQQQWQTTSAQCQEGPLGVQAFADQAHFVGLMAAVLSAVQVLTLGAASSTQTSVPSTAQLKQAVPALLQQCDQWLQQHSSAISPEQQPGAAAVSVQQQRHAEAVRWRNRALRSISATAAADVKPLPASLATGSGAGAGAAGHVAHIPAAAMPGIWLPEQCWDPPSRKVAYQAGRSAKASGSGRASWQMLMPQPSSQAQQQLQQSGLGCMPADGSSTEAEMAGFSAAAAAAAAAAPVLTYSDVAEVVQHSRQLQKIQQLSLQLAVESQAAPSLLNVLLQCCQQLQQQAAAGTVGDESVTHDRCCALYRLLCALTAGPIKERGLGVGCQLAVEVEVTDDRLPGW